MMICGRFIILLFLAGTLVLLPASPVYPSYNSEAARLYAVASQRLAEIRKNPKKKKYRSYWIDCIRSFDLVERRFPKSSYAGDACYYRADIYGKLYQHSRIAKDIEESAQTYVQCQSAYPGHPRAPEALYRIFEIELFYKKDIARAGDAYARLMKTYPGSRWTSKTRARLRAAAPKELARRQTRFNAERPEKTVPAAIVESIRYRSSGNYTRIVIDHDGKTNYRVLELKDPARLVFDLLNTHLGQSVDKEPLTVNDGILRRVRASQYEPETVRIVLDLASIKNYAAFPLRDPERLVIDVMGEGINADKAGAESDLVQEPAAGSVTEARARALQGINAPVPRDGPGLSLSRQLGLKIRTIAIDAGHGGHDPGAVGREGMKEKTITLDIAKRLATLVKEGLGRNVVMTRDSDQFVPLEDRPAIARTKGADLFVSVHVNATRRRGARGIETYIQGLSASDHDAMETASRENAATAKTLGQLDDELAKILAGLRMVSNDEDSILLAHAVQRSLVNAVKPVQRQANDLGVKRAFFYVLINTGMPSILAEVGFISNPTEERLLRKPSYRQTLAEAIYSGLKKYIESREPRPAG